MRNALMIALAVTLGTASVGYGQGAAEKGSVEEHYAIVDAQRESFKWMAEKTTDGTIVTVGKEKPNAPYIVVGEKFLELEAKQQTSLIRMVFNLNLKNRKRDKQPLATIYADNEGKPGKKLGTFHVNGGLKLIAKKTAKAAK